jgi:hypothetical protein
MGCTSVPKTPQELKISRASIVAGDNETKVDIDGWPDKTAGAVVGGAKGAGIGVGSAAVLCLAAGPMYPVCIIGAIPLGTLGATVGTVAGAVTTESADSVEIKRSMLTEELSSLDANKYLATLVYKKSLESLALQPSQADSASTAANPEWTLRIGLDEFATVGSGPDTPYSLQLSARIEAIRLGDKESAFIKEYQATSPIQKTTAEWRVNNVELVWSALDGLLSTLATDITNDWMPIQLSLDKTLEDYNVPVKPKTIEMRAEPVAALTSDTSPKTGPGASLESETVQSPPHTQDETSNPDQSYLFDPVTRLNWTVVASGPVDLGTANSVCGSLETGDKKNRVPSLREFEELWKRYKNDECISIFKKREYITDSKNLFGRVTYPQTFSFTSGTPGQPSQLRAAYLTCVSQ